MASLEEDCLERSTDCNFIVMSNAGKPIFARYGDEEEVARVCGLLEAVRTSITYSRTLGLGDIQSLRSGSLAVVFMAVGSITLVALSPINANDDSSFSSGETETFHYLKLQLEYLFALIIFTMTEQVQSMFQHNASFDLRTMLGATEGTMRDMLNDAGPEGEPGPFLLGGAQTVFPLSPAIRDRMSQVLQSVGSKTADTVFALLIADGKLLSLVQSAFRPHQLRVSDMHLLLHCLGRHQGLLSSELWLPVCLPRFNSSGFLYCYTHCLDVETKLVLVLVSQHGTTDQFELFRGASSRIRSELSLPVITGSVLRIHGTDTSVESAHGVGSDVVWSRTAEEVTTNEDEDYVDASGDGDNMIPYMAGASETDFKPEFMLLKELKCSMEPIQLGGACGEYLDLAQAVHFIYRFDAPVQTHVRQARGSKGGHLAQCVSSLVCAPFDSPKAKRRLWSRYQKLSLRLRLGSASVESTMDAFDMISQDHADAADDIAPGIGKHCPSTGLVESPPNMEGLSYIMDENEIFLALNGSDFEL